MYHGQPNYEAGQAQGSLRGQQVQPREASGAQYAQPQGTAGTRPVQPQGARGSAPAQPNGTDDAWPADSAQDGKDRKDAPSKKDDSKGKKPLRISSPEQVDDYIRVTTPGMWLLVAAMLVLLAAGIIWGYAAGVEMKTTDQNGEVTTEYVAPASFLTDAGGGS